VSSSAHAACLISALDPRKGAIMILAASLEFDRNHNPEVVERRSDKVEIPQLMKSLSNLQKKKRELPLCYPYSIKTRCLIHAHLSRIALPKSTLVKG
jgi:translocation protein SEC63